MNLPQAEAIVKLLREARHPRADAITGEFYTAEEYAELGEPFARGFGYCGSTSDGPEMIEVKIDPARRQRDVDLYVDVDGRIWSWSTIEIPPEDCDCECPGPPTSKVDRSGCPVHGTAIRELDCFRRASIGWWIPEDRPPRWRFRVTLGDPIRDVLAEYRAERAVHGSR